MCDKINFVQLFNNIIKWSFLDYLLVLNVTEFASALLTTLRTFLFEKIGFYRRIKNTLNILQNIFIQLTEKLYCFIYLFVFQIIFKISN